MLRHFRIAAAALAVVITAAGCGIKGPLVLPPAKPAPVVVPAPEAPPPTTSPTPANTPLPAPGAAPAGERKP